MLADPTLRPMVYNPHVHARRSIRLQHYDYRSAGAYFVTICSHARACIFDDALLARIVQFTWCSVVKSPMSCPNEILS